MQNDLLGPLDLEGQRCLVTLSSLSAGVLNLFSIVDSIF